MFDPYNNYNPYANEPDELKGLSEEERLKVALCTIVGYVLALAIGLCVCALFNSCTTPRAVEEHHHHHYEADTMAVHAQVDRQLSSWHEEMTQFFTERLEQFSSQMQQSEHQQETISELITVSTDSVGRTIRQEQRTITRDITRELQQQEQRITQEYEARLHAAIDSVGSSWQSRYDSLSSHVAQLDSTLTKKTPVGDTRPWYQRWRDALEYLIIGAILALALWLTRKWWKKLFAKLV